MKGLSLLRKLIDMEEWSKVCAVARSELPVTSSKITRINLDLHDKDVSGFPDSLRQSACNRAGPCLAEPLEPCQS